MYDMKNLNNTQLQFLVNNIANAKHAKVIDDVLTVDLGHNVSVDVTCDSRHGVYIGTMENTDISPVANKPEQARYRVDAPTIASAVMTCAGYLELE